MKAKALKELGDRLFSKKRPLDSLWQEIADNFYPERATFTVQRNVGTDFASNLLSSYPILCRRDLSGQFTSLLRPASRPWFHTGLRFEENTDNDTKTWLQAFEDTQRRAMYDPRALLQKATAQGDNDIAAFGQAALSIELNRYADGLLYRCWHLKDMAWQENEDGQACPIFRKWKTTAQILEKTFGKDKLHAKIQKSLEKEPFTEYTFMHMIVEADMYDDDARGKPYFSVWYDCDHSELVDASAVWAKHYVIPRWQSVSESQYAFSPATVAALPDARLLQAMSWTLLEAGERATWPPMVATVDAVRSDIGNFAGGITWVDPEYDERLGEALRPISQDFRGFNFGLEMNANAMGMLKKAFYLDTLTMPTRGPEMTAYEVSQRIQQYIRDALPLFEPLEAEYNAQMCEMTFELLWRSGAFGSPLSWPQALQGADIAFTFESPLHDAIDEAKGQKFLEGQSLLSGAMQLDPSTATIVDARVALRDALTGIGIPPKWLRNESDVKAIDDAQAREREIARLLDAAEQAGGAARDFGAAQKSVSEAQPVL